VEAIPFALNVRQLLLWPH